MSMQFTLAMDTMRGQQRASRGLRGVAALLAMSVALAACGNKEKAASQSLASVDGTEITTLQLNDEMAQAGVQAGQQEALGKRVLDSLIERQLLLAAATNDKIDRDPKVLQAIERAKAQIVAQAYLQKRIGNIPRPSAAEVNAYFQQHPEFFSKRQQFDMRQLVLATKDMSDELKAAIDSAKSLDEVADWLKTHNIQFGAAQLVRTSADLAPEMVTKLSSMRKGQLFIVREAGRSVIVALGEIKDAPVTLEAATPQIEQFLVGNRSKEAAAAELERLRKVAKIEYLNKNFAQAPAAPVPAKAATNASTSTARGVAGLK